VTTFTRQLSILQDAGLPIVRSLKILEGNAKPGKLKNALAGRGRGDRGRIDVVRRHGQVARRSSTGCT
jgi:hypothetical protein